VKGGSTRKEVWEAPWCHTTKKIPNRGNNALGEREAEKSQKRGENGEKGLIFSLLHLKKNRQPNYSLKASVSNGIFSADQYHEDNDLAPFKQPRRGGKKKGRQLFQQPRHYQRVKKSVPSLKKTGGELPLFSKHGKGSRRKKEKPGRGGDVVPIAARQGKPKNRQKKGETAWGVLQGSSFQKSHPGGTGPSEKTRQEKTANGCPPLSRGCQVK